MSNIKLNIKLIVGLANPGIKYELTRHNVGSWYIKLLAQKYKQILKLKSNFFGCIGKINLYGNSIYLFIPKIYMNFNGKAVLSLVNFYHIPPEKILVVHDELNLIPGKAKIKFGGTNNGHNGLKDIQEKLGHNSNFYRLRIGIGHPGDKHKVIQFLLNKPTIQEQKLINITIKEAIFCTEILLNQGMHKAINRLHSFKAFC
ncbi:aminoacyl-tRNA hydrolase [Arsenophonus symbiont of Ornithomya chloropus]|uniref:aminoacyl-tRNA hydrolase n=1 Tax=Arsenophonus symbiont of Ornithomya chloropus TaxID=634121 RepID=UPI0032B2164A